MKFNDSLLKLKMTGLEQSKEVVLTHLFIHCTEHKLFFL